MTTEMPKDFNGIVNTYFTIHEEEKANHVDPSKCRKLVVKTLEDGKQTVEIRPLEWYERMGPISKLFGCDNGSLEKVIQVYNKQDVKNEKLDSLLTRDAIKKTIPDIDMLKFACIRGDLKTVQEFIKQGKIEKLMAEDSTLSPLLLAYKNDNAEVFNTLLEASYTHSNLRYRPDGDNYIRPIEYFCLQGDIEVIKKYQAKEVGTFSLGYIAKIPNFLNLDNETKKELYQLCIPAAEAKFPSSFAPRSLFEAAFRMNDFSFIKENNLVEKQELNNLLSIVCKNHGSVSEDTLESTLDAIFTNKNFTQLNFNQKSEIITILIKDVGEIAIKQKKKEKPSNLFESVQKEGLAGFALKQKKEFAQRIGLEEQQETTQDTPETAEKPAVSYENLSESDQKKYFLLGVLFKPLYELHKIAHKPLEAYEPDKKAVIVEFSKNHKVIEFPDAVPIR